MFLDSLMQFISTTPDYVIFDLETSDLNSRTAEIIEISALKVKESKIIEEFIKLVKPKGILNPKATEVNGITYSMLECEKYIEDIFPDFLKFIGNSQLVGYNIASYDLPIIKRVAASLNYNINNDYVDLLYLAREKMNFLPNCSLSTIASYFVIDIQGAHRGLKDCEITKQCYDKLIDFVPPNTDKNMSKQFSSYRTDQSKALQQLHALLLGVIADDKLTEDEVMTLNKWIQNNKELEGQFPYDRVAIVINEALADGILEQYELDEMLELFKEFTNPTTENMIDDFELENKAICLTGNFELGEKNIVEQLITNKGGIIKKSVSSKTDYVIVGTLGSPDWTCGNYGSKIKKARELQEKGNNIKIVTESTLTNYLNNN